MRKKILVGAPVVVAALVLSVFAYQKYNRSSASAAEPAVVNAALDQQPATTYQPPPATAQSPTASYPPPSPYESPSAYQARIQGQRPAQAMPPGQFSDFVIPEGTRVQVRLNESLGTAQNRPGDPFSAILNSPVMVDGAAVIPQGTVFHGHLTEAKPSGRLRGRGYLAVKLDSFDMGGRSYDIDTSSRSRATRSHKKRNLVLIGGGSGFGALVGGLAGGVKGGLIGAGAGAAVGTAGAAFTGKKQVYLPAETLLTFTLREPVHVTRA